MEMKMFFFFASKQMFTIFALVLKLFHMYSFSFFRRPVSNSVPCRDITLRELYFYLVSNYADETTRAIAECNDDNSRRLLKRKTLDYITPACRCVRRTTHGVVSVSGLMVLDFDHIFNPLSFYAPLIRSFNPLLLFVSPSGQGLKMIRQWTNETGVSNHTQAEKWAAAYKEEFEAVNRWVLQSKELGGLQIDKSGSDLVRACYVPRCFYPWASPSVFK